jgi:hypothetical protein
MTAEIAILNRQAIALAADSAVTVQTSAHSKVWQSANKIFGLGRHHSVGVMVYGSAEFMRIPWETVIKLYRDQLTTTPFETLGEYKEDFLRFLRGNKALFPADEQEFFFTAAVAGPFLSLREEIEDTVAAEIEANGSVTPEKVIEIVETQVKDWQAGLEARARLNHLPKGFGRATVTRYSASFESVRSEVFQELPLTSAASRRLRTIAGLVFERDLFSSDASGVVIAGFGAAEYFPGFVALTLDGLLNGELNYREDGTEFISRDSRGSVMAFAQGDVVYAFMEGVDMRYQRLMEEALERILQHYPSVIIDAVPGLTPTKRAKMKEDFAQAAAESFDTLTGALSHARRQNHWQPIVEVVSVLPKDELAAMAESLVNLTSFRRKVSLQLETVGGPIDVAVISKGDGFVWIKRKNYFPREQNPHFTARYN